MQTQLRVQHLQNLSGRIQQLTLNKINRLVALMLVLSSFIYLPRVNALTISDTQLKDTLSFEGQNLVLNGAGIRTKLFLKVYIGALYVSSRTKDADAIIDSATPRVIELTFLRDVDGEKISTAFREGFTKNCIARCEELKSKIEELAKAVPAIKQGQLLQITATKEGVSLNLDGKSMTQVKAQDLGREMTRIFIGKNPPTEDLKKGLLGA